MGTKCFWFQTNLTVFSGLNLLKEKTWVISIVCPFSQVGVYQIIWEIMTFILKSSLSHGDFEHDEVLEEKTFTLLYKTST